MANNQETRNVLIVGCGGQGVILASNILSDVLSCIDHMDVKKSETHGMSQRGGSVHAQVRFGEKVYSPFISPGEAQVILAFEEAEGLRWSHYLAKDGIMILNQEKVIPPLAFVGLAEYPEAGLANLKKHTEVKCIDANDIARQIGNVKVASVVLLGALAAKLDFPEEIWKENLVKRVPAKALEANLKAFDAGFTAMKTL
ncbi:MAG: indolepyruvate oxidoreductase subunit beta [Clostridiales bacterium]